MTKNTSTNTETALPSNSLVGSPPSSPIISSSTPDFTLPIDPSQGTQTYIDDSPPKPKILRAQQFTSKYRWYDRQAGSMESQRRSMHDFLQVSRERFEERSRSPQERYHLNIPNLLGWDKYKQITRWQSRRDRDQVVRTPPKSAEQELGERKADGYGGPILVGRDLTSKPKNGPWTDITLNTFGSKLPNKWCGRLNNSYGWAMMRNRLGVFWEAASLRGVDRYGSTATFDFRWAALMIWLFLVIFLAIIINGVKRGGWMKPNGVAQPKLAESGHNICRIRVRIVDTLVYMRRLLGWP